jgi:hypothetical protein
MDVFIHTSDKAYEAGVVEAFAELVAESKK